MQNTHNRPGRDASVRGKRRTFTSAGPRRDHGDRGRPQRGSRSTQRGGGSRGGRGPRKMPSFDPTRFINTNPADVVEEAFVPQHRFDAFGLSERLVQTMAHSGMASPTPIQDQIIPKILEGRDVIGIAETGTGKTAAFLVPLIENLLKKPNQQTLILAPTRELAVQIDAELRTLSKGFKIYSVTCVGGMNIQPQIRALRHHNHFVIGTPGRVLDLIKRRVFHTQDVTSVVLDEADRMLDMGFIHDIRTILSATKKERHTLLFSATMSKEAENLVNDFLRDPVVISVKKKDVTNTIEQDIVPYDHNNKYETLLALLRDPVYKRVIIFGSMKHSVEKLARQLTADGVHAESIHGNKSHGQRQRALQSFKNGRVQVLVATDVAARGIHVESVSHVINYDLPNTFEDYVHRIGRTGRGVHRGKARTFVPKTVVGPRQINRR